MIKKIADVPIICTDPEHKPPMHIVLEPGVYEHTCPGCGAKITFTIQAKTYNNFEWVSGVEKWPEFSRNEKKYYLGT